MLSFSKYRNRLIYSTACLIVLMIIAAVFSRVYDSWTDSVISKSRQLSESCVDKILARSNKYIDSLQRKGVFNPITLTEIRFDKIDSSLSLITKKVLNDYNGMEGGFYFSDIDKFLGYSFPTSPPPIPVFGPPPRSYDMILQQIQISIRQRKSVSKLHQFDPAIFPLVTVPLEVKGKVIGCAWARVHIEKEMPATILKSIFNTTTLIALTAFIFVVIAYFRFRRQLIELKLDIEQIEKEPDHKVSNLSGVFGSVGGYINKMVGSLSQEHEHRQQLERELLQKEKMATLGQLISGVVHEVKTPLAIIKTRVQLWQQQLKKNSDTESAANNVVDENSIQIVVDEIDRLSRLVRRLLYFSKPAKPVWQTLNIEHVFDRAASMVHFNHTFELVSSFAPDIPLCKGDAGGLEQIFINGLVNAIEAMPEGGNVAVAASYDVSRDEVLIEISDNGPGIPSELRNKIFEPFFTTKSGGVGLGLAICKEIIQSHNGSITIRENIPNGTILSIRISTNRNK